ncbi:MAG: (deoxy)nucleoside triphosphate pyrophosphohydrolase [Bdellovibrionaceae bacterium]|nr:(deoxy)nucleoside triphosphate pyrophosphohydrolase [Bdellovibrio sp.]
MSVSTNLKKSQPIEVVALALQRTLDNRYLIARRGPGQSGAGEWEFPGGKVEVGELQTGALVREIDEELGLELTAEKLKLVTDHVHSYPNKTVHIFLWKIVLSDTPTMILTEHDDIRWCTPAEMIAVGLSQGDRAFISVLSSLT